MSGLKPLNTNDLEKKLVWEKPERKDQAGALMIFGGVSLKLKNVDAVFRSAKECGVGTIQTLVPESLARVFKREDQHLTAVNFDNYYGLSDTGFKTLTEEFALADSLVLADIGSSSATEHKLALAVSKTFKPVIIFEASFNLVLNYPAEILDNPQITIVASLQDIQKLIKAIGLKLEGPLLSSSPLKSKIEAISQLSRSIRSKIIMLDESRAYSAEGDLQLSIDCGNIRGSDLAARLACWQIWAPNLGTMEHLYASVKKI